MNSITISRQHGSGGDEVAARVCQLLGYHEFDKRLIIQAAVAAGLSEQEIFDYTEENFKVKNFLDRLLRRQSPLPQVRVWREDTTGARIPEDQALSETAALILVQKAVRAAYQAGSTVIVGRGGQVILKDEPDVLHIRIEAPMEDRIQRVKAVLKEAKGDTYADVGIRRDAQDLIVERDAASAGYLKQHYGVDWADPYLYHAVLNTGRMSVAQAAETVADMARCLFGQAITRE